MACFDKGAITIKPQLWFDSDVAVWYKGVRAGVVKQAAGGDDYVCLLSMEWDGQSFLQQCSRSDSIEQGAEVVAHRFWLRNETPEVHVILKKPRAWWPYTKGTRFSPPKAGRFSSLAASLVA